MVNIETSTGESVAKHTIRPRLALLLLSIWAGFREGARDGSTASDLTFDGRAGEVALRESASLSSCSRF